MRPPTEATVNAVLWWWGRKPACIDFTVRALAKLWVMVCGYISYQREMRASRNIRSRPYRRSQTTRGHECISDFNWFLTMTGWLIIFVAELIAKRFESAKHTNQERYDKISCSHFSSRCVSYPETWGVRRGCCVREWCRCVLSSEYPTHPPCGPPRQCTCGN